PDLSFHQVVSEHKSKVVEEQSLIATIYQKIDPALLQFCLFSCFLYQVEPKKVSDALQDPSWVEAMSKELLQFKITLVDCPKGFKPIGTKWVLKNKKGKRGIVVRNKARLVAQGHTQEDGIDYVEVFAPVARIEAIRLFLAYASFMGFTVYQMDVKSAFLYGTIDEEGKDGTGKDVDLHLYRSMIGSLMYLTASRPDIMFAVLAYSDSDYGGASQDCKSTTRGSQFLGRRLISWQCKKQMIVATSTTEAEYVAAASCSGQVLWIQNQLLDYGIHTAKTFDLVWIWLGGDYGNVFINGFSWDSVLNMCRNYLHGSLSEQMTHEFMYINLATGEFNTDFHPMVDFIAASPLRYALTVKPTIFVSYIRQFWSTARIETTDEGTYILATVEGIQRTVFESSLRRNLKLRDEDGIVSIPDTELFENLTLMGIVPLFDTMLVHQGEGSGTPTEPHHTPTPEVDTSDLTTSSISLPSLPTDPIPPVSQTDTTPIRQYSRRARIAQSSALPTVADEPASPVRDVSEWEACPTESGFIADQDRATIANVAAKHSGDDAPIKGRSINEGKAVAERISNDSEEIERVLTFMDAATVLAGGIDVPTGSGSIPTVDPFAADISLAVKELEEQQEKEDMRMNEQITRDTKVARIHAEEELQGMIDSLDRSNETVAKYLQEYQDFGSELPLEKKIELICDLVKYHENYSKVYKFQSQQRRPMTKKQKRDYYMAVIRSNLGWKVKDFKGMTFEEIKAKFAAVWKQVEDFIPMGSKEETKRLKRKGLNLEQEHVKKQKTSEEALKIEKSTEEISEEKMKEMMQLVPVEDIYVQALQVKHPIIEWKFHTEGQRSY
nr:putative ribonuclease H-like domain-containing protein [Tanacetum cinerariifolium]